MVEGILIFADRTLRELFDVKIFVDTDPDIRLIRRLERDIAERGRTTESGHSSVPVHGPPDAPGICRAVQTLRRCDHPGRGLEPVAMDMVVAPARMRSIRDRRHAEQSSKTHPDKEYICLQNAKQWSRSPEMAIDPKKKDYTAILHTEQRRYPPPAVRRQSPATRSTTSSSWPARAFTMAPSSTA